MRIVVGVDGSESALEAVRLATREAAWRGCPLRIVHGFIWPVMRIPAVPLPAPLPEGGLRQEAERFLAVAASVAAQTDPRVPVETELIVGAPTPVLLAEAASASLVVLGDRGLGGFSGLLVGSVAVQMAPHSPVPVLVAKDGADHLGPVVVGLDGSGCSLAAAGHAFQEAAHRGVHLLAVHTKTSPGDMPALAQLLAEHSTRFPDVIVRTEVVDGPPGGTLVRLGEQAQLLVVGSRGRGGFTGLLLGSVSQQVLHHARCPVMIVPCPR